MIMQQNFWDYNSIEYFSCNFSVCIAEKLHEIGFKARREFGYDTGIATT